MAPTEEQLRQEPWYHGRMTRRAAERLLRADGDFLVRDSATNPGQYVLTGMQAGQPKHLLLVDPEGVVRGLMGGGSGFPRPHQTPGVSAQYESPGVHGCGGGRVLQEDTSRQGCPRGVWHRSPKELQVTEQDWCRQLCRVRVTTGGDGAVWVQAGPAVSLRF